MTVVHARVKVFFKQVRSVGVSRFDHDSQVFIDQRSLTGSFVNRELLPNPLSPKI